jgi:hypothetical protein
MKLPLEGGKAVRRLVFPCNQLPLTPTLSPLSRGEGVFS